MLRYLAFLSLLAVTPAAAQDSNFPTPGNARVPGYVTMCLNGSNQAIPCAAGGGLAAGAAVTGCPAGANLFVTAGLLLGCTAVVTEADTGDPLTLTGQLVVKAGAVTTPSINWGTNTGFFGVGGSNIQVAINGSNFGNFSAGGFAQNLGNFSLPAAGNLNWANVAFFYGPSTATFRFGGNDAAAPVAQTLGVQNVVTGTSNTGGANFTFNASKSTGTGVGGKVILQTTVTGLTGTTVNSNFPMLSLNPGSATTSTLQLGDGTNITTYDSCTGFTSSATGVIACTTSAMRFKDMFPAQALNLVGLDALRTDVPWKYKDDAGYGLDTKRVHVGLFADDVEKLDSRCVTYDGGVVKDYEDRCMIAYLVADRQKMKAEIEDLKRMVGGR